MKLIIAGSRDFNDYFLMCKSIASLGFKVDEVVSGGARGADSLGEKWAFEHLVPVRYFPAHWVEEGRAAGINRNHKMGNYADYLIAFWDGKSPGTLDMITYMQQLGKPVEVIKF